MSLGLRLAEVMTERRPRITQEQLADRVGSSQRAVAGWLKGVTPHAKTLNRICLALGVRRDWLLYGEGDKYLPKDAIRVEEMPPTYSRREKITFIEEQAPELLPMVDAFLDSVGKQPGAQEKPNKKKGKT